MKILFYTNVPSPYRVDFFNELGKYCELTVLFETDCSTERDATWKEFQFQNFHGVILKGIRSGVDSAFCPEIIKYLKKNVYDHIVVTQVASYTAILAAAYMNIRKIPYCYEGDGGFVSSVSGIKAWLKRMVISGARFCFSTSKEFDKYCVAYGAKKDRIYRYSLSSIMKKDVLSQIPAEEEKRENRERLGIREEKVLLSVGQFIFRKGFDLLLELARELPDVGIYIVGGKPTEEFLEIKNKYHLEHVHFVDFMKKEQLSLYYQSADLFVFPTREDIWGLVINEAMAKGLPVVSTNRCIAALEMIEDEKNGYIIPVNDVPGLKKAVESVLDSPELRKMMSEYALETMKNNYTIEHMAKKHMDVFKKEFG